MPGTGIENVNSLSASDGAVPLRSGRSSAIHQVARRVQRDVDDLGAGVERREHETLGGAAGRNRAQMKGLRPEKLVHPAIGAVGRDQLERHQQQQRQKNHQQRQKQPADQAERREPLDDREMVRAGGFQRRVVIRVDLAPAAVAASWSERLTIRR